MNIRLSKADQGFRSGRPFIQSFFTGFTLLLMLVLAGCLSKPSLVKESFAFTPPRPEAASDENQNVPVLAVRRIFVAPPFDSQTFTYRTAESSFERDPYAGFLVVPSESLAEPVRQYLRNSGFVRVPEPDSSLEPDFSAEFSVTQLYGDFREQSKPAAELDLRLIVFRNSRGGPGKVVLQKSYSRRTPLDGRTAVAVMHGWNEALKGIMDEVSKDLKGAIE